MSSTDVANASDRTGPMDDGALSALLRQQIYDAMGYDETELSAKREKALNYYNGIMPDLPSMPGRSSVTTRDLSDAVGWILPGLMRVFAGADNIVTYDPQNPEDEQGARQATDYINYLFRRECDGYRVLHSACHDALRFANGIVKHWWDEAKQYSTHRYTWLDDQALAVLQNDKEVEILDLEETQAQDPMAGQPITLYNVKAKRVCSYGRLRLMALPSEEYLIERGATSIEDANFHCHRSMRTRQSLIEDGFDPELVMQSGTDGDLFDTSEYRARWDRFQGNDTIDRPSDPLMETIEVFECYTRVDFDGDGHAEWRKIVLIGPFGLAGEVGNSGGSLLSNEEWSDEVPFSDLVPMPEPHRWVGRSLLDELEDIQRVKTTILRQTLDNLYLSNVPNREALAGAVENPDELVNPSLGGTLWVRQLGAINQIAIPFVAEKSYAMLEYQDSMAEKRTGVSRTSMALDPDALQDQTAAGQLMAQSAAYAKIELYARNIAELGLKRLFRCILKLVVAHQDKPKMIRLRGTWVPMDPRQWNADMDVSISVGLGSGSRDRDIAILGQIAAKQEMAIAQGGAMNPIANVQKYSNTLRRMVEAAGIRDPDQYFAEVDEAALAQIQQSEANKPDPKMAEAQGKLQIEQQKMQMDAQAKQADMVMQHQKQQADAQLDMAKVQAQSEADRAKLEAEMNLKREQLTAELMLKREQLVAELQLKREEMAAELELKRELGFGSIAAKANGAGTSPVRPGGEPG